MLQFDILFNDLGEIGLAQICIGLILGCTVFSSGINSLATVFIAYESDFRCNVSPLDNETIYPMLNESTILNLTTPYDPTTGTYKRCYRYGYNLTSCNGDIDCVNTSYPVIPCDNGYHFNRTMFTDTVLTEFNLVCDLSIINPISVSLYYAGIGFGAIFFGNLGDRYGRKKCIIVTYFGVLCCMLGIAFSSSIYVYILCRFASAAFVFGATDNSFSYIMEILGTKWRSKFSYLFHSAFPLGYLILVGIAYKWRNYHSIMLVATICVAPVFFLLFLIPESPRWLFSQNKTSQGIKVVTKLARINKVQIQEKTWDEAKRVAEVNNANKKTDKRQKYTALNLFKTKRIALMTLKVMFLWFVNSAVYYGVSLNSGALAGDFFLNNILYGIFELAAFVVCAATIDRFGRAFLETFFLLLTGISFALSVIVNAFAETNEDLLTLATVFVFIARFGICSSFSIVYNMTAELFPTVVRSNAIGAGSIAARIGGILASFILYLQDIAWWFPNITFCAMSISAGLLSFTIPETKERFMMETIEEAETFYDSKKKKQTKNHLLLVENEKKADLEIDQL